MKIKRRISLIDELELFLDVYAWMRAKAYREALVKLPDGRVRKGAVKVQHAAILRRVVFNGTISLLDCRKATGIRPYTATRAAKDLENWGLITRDSTGKKVSLYAKQRGRAALKRFDELLEKSFLKLLGLTSQAVETQALRETLHTLTGFLPRQALGSPRFYVPQDVDHRSDRPRQRQRRRKKAS